jgi:hypothetical protein
MKAYPLLKHDDEGEQSSQEGINGHLIIEIHNNLYKKRQIKI